MSKRQKLAVEVPPKRAVQSIDEAGLPTLVPPESRDAAFDEALAMRAVPLSEAAAAAGGEGVGAGAGAEAEVSPEEEEMRRRHEAHMHLLAARDEMLKLKWTLEMAGTGQMGIARLDTERQPPTAEQRLEEGGRRLEAKQQRLSAAAARLRDRAAALRTTVAQGKAYHEDLARLNRAWRVGAAPAALRQRLGPGRRHVVDCFMPGCLGAGHGGESFVALSEKEGGGVAVAQPAGGCRLTVSEGLASEGDGRTAAPPAAAAEGAPHQALRRAQRGLQAQLLWRQLLREAKDIQRRSQRGSTQTGAKALAPQSAGGRAAGAGGRQVSVVIDPDVLHVQYLPGRYLRFERHPDEPAAAASTGDDDDDAMQEEETDEGSGSTDDGWGVTPMSLLLRDLVLRTAAGGAAAAHPSILGQLITAARYRAAREDVTAILQRLVARYRLAGVRCLPPTAATSAGGVEIPERCEVPERCALELRLSQPPSTLRVVLGSAPQEEGMARVQRLGLGAAGPMGKATAEVALENLEEYLAWVIEAPGEGWE